MKLLWTLAVYPMILLSVAAWSWTPGTFKGSRVWKHSNDKRNLASYKNKFGYKDQREKRDVRHPLMFNRETRLPSFHPHLRGSKMSTHSIREKRSEAKWQLQDCMTVSSKEEGVWEYKSDGRQETCGLYLVTMPDMLVELEIIDLNVDCDSGLVVLFDGWELNGNVFPGNDDHHLDLDQRSHPICTGDSSNVRRLLSSQNAALISFKIPTPGQGFKLRVNYHPNPYTCNILMSDMTGLFTLQNHGKAMNCSLTTLLFPANFELRAMAVGPFTSSRYRRETDAVSQGLSTNCDPDFVELGGSAELDSSHLVTSHTLCGTQNSPGKGLTVLCGSSTVRLVSSGEYDNSVTVLVKAATDADLDFDSNLVMACPEFMGAA